MKPKRLKSKLLIHILTFALLSIQLLTNIACASQTSSKSSISFFSMDTIMTVTVYRNGHTEEQTQTALDAAKNEILRIERLFSVTSESGEIATLNRGETLASPSSELIELIGICKELYEATNGKYDITVYPLAVLWGFTASNEPKLPDQASIDNALENVNGSKIEITENADGTQNIKTNGAMIDLGSVAKGLAGQSAADRLIEMGFNSFIMSLGGNVQTAITKPDNAEFTVGIADPDAPDSTVLTLSTKQLAQLFDSEEELKTLSVVTSGTYQRCFTENGTLYHHLLDTESGYPCNNGLCSVTVVTTDGAMADALSTALFLLGYDGAIQYYEDHGGFEAIFISDSGEISSTSGISALINK